MPSLRPAFVPAELAWEADRSVLAYGSGYRSYGTCYQYGIRTGLIMGQRLFVGDLVRPTAAAAVEGLPCRSRHHYGPQFQARRPALVVHVIEPDRDRDSFLCLVAFRLKNGTWKQLDRRFPFSQFDLVHRPSSSGLLNPFDLQRATPVLRVVWVHLAKTFYAVIPDCDGPGRIDPDVPPVIGGRPVIPEVLGQAIRSSLKRIESHRHHYVDGRWSEPFLTTMLARADAAHVAACDEVRARYKVATPHPFGGGSEVLIRELQGGFKLHPTMKYGGCRQGQCLEAVKYVDLRCTDREFGDSVLGMLNQPNVPVDHAAKIDPFVGRILPYINVDAMEADIRRHWAA